ncbi:MAG: hypothetical protein Q8K92_04140 [Leadbetterella sp.]|nr:hypothetical protein [Leadbetterella sp.]
MKNVNQLFDLMTKSDGLIPSTGWNRPFQEFTCEYCGQHFSKEFCQISVFLHGIFFLFGEESGYLGFTCANCQKTILFQGSGREIRTLHTEMIADCFSFNGALSLSYFSSVNYYPSQIPRLNNFDIKCSGHFVKDPWLADKSYILRDIHQNYTDGRNFTDIDKRPDLKLNYLCSDQDQMKNYSYNYLGHLVTLWWFKEDEITKLRDLENSSNLKIFPRYVARQFTDFEDIENYCWKHKLYLEFLNTHLKMTEITNKEIEGSEHHIIFDGYHEPDDGEFVINDDNTIPLWQIENSIREEEKRRKTELRQTAQNELAQIIITPKNYWITKPSVDIPISIEFWNNAIKLFDSKEASKIISDFMPENIEQLQQDKKDFNEMSRKISQYFAAHHVQEFLVENHDSFVEAYTKLAQTKDFTYTTVWKLKKELLIKLYSNLLENERNLLVSNIKNKPKPRPGTIDKGKVQGAAKELWGHDPTITITAMSKTQEIIEACGNAYRERTIYNWVKEVAPSHNPGRPKKEK